MEYFPNFEFSVADERRYSEDREALWDKWPFQSKTGFESIPHLEEGVDDSDIDDIDIGIDDDDDMLFINGYNEQRDWMELDSDEDDEEGMTVPTGSGYYHCPEMGARKGECSSSNSSNNVTGLTSVALPTSAADNEKTIQQLPCRRGSDESLDSASTASASSYTSTSPSSTTSNRSFKFPSGPPVRSQPIDIRRPKRVLILLESGVVVTPSSDYTSGNDQDTDEDSLIESAILEPRSPPQERRMPVIHKNNASKTLKAPPFISQSSSGKDGNEANTTNQDTSAIKRQALNAGNSGIDGGPVSTIAPSIAKPGGAMAKMLTADTTLKCKKGRTSTILSNDSDISALDIGPSLLKEQHQHQHQLD